MTFAYDFARFIPFRDAVACARARSISRCQLTKHPNPQFRIEVIENRTQFYHRFALDLVRRICEAEDACRPCVLILPAEPAHQYEIAAGLINRLEISCRHLVTFNASEYADELGRTAPPNWAGSLAMAMMRNFFSRIQPPLRPRLENIHAPSDDNISSYHKLIEDAGGADCCYGAVGWSGQIAFWEGYLGTEYGSDVDAYKQAAGRVVELSAMTVMQLALQGRDGDWSRLPPKAATIGPRECVAARDRSFWLDGDLGCGVAWQRFIARLVAHGPVTPLVPGSLLQETSCDYHLVGGVADDVDPGCL